MADSVDRVFAHALSTVRKIPRTGSARPPPAERLRLYGLYKQSMEGDVEGVMARPAANETAEEKAEVDKWDAWHACAGLSRTEAKRRYITTLIHTMHVYAAGTAEARALVEELEFVWEQVRGNYEAQLRAEENANHPTEPTATSRSRNDNGLRILRPMSDNDAHSGAAPAAEDDDAIAGPAHADDQESFADARSYSSASRPPPPYSRSQSPSSDHLPSRDATPEAAANWRRRVSRALVQLTAEVAALRELADGSSTSALGRYLARSRRRRRNWLFKVWTFLWQLVRRILVDATVVALIVIILRWRWRTSVEGAWEVLGVWLGFVGDEVRGKLRDGMREGIKMGQGVGIINGRNGRSVTEKNGVGRQGDAP